MPGHTLSLVKLLKYGFLGPRLYRIHAHDSNAGVLYQPGTLENTGDTVIKWMKFCWSFAYWTSPVVLSVLYRRGFFSVEGIASLTSYGTGISLILIVAFWVRAIGRLTSVDYKEFASVLDTALKQLTPENKRLLSIYDGEFYAWPVDFFWNEGSRGDGTKPKITVARNKPVTNRSTADAIKAVPCHMLSYVAAHTFGRRMVFPGTTALVRTLMGPLLVQGRASLIEEKNGVRAKMRTEDGNDIDTMFVDRRNNSAYPNGNVLVICSEGNSGFYEVGCMVTPLEAGYSVLGWNHPGFGGSSGVPLPPQEQNAIDSVVQYAIHRLGFQPYDIVLFAWSIGGYAASWAAMNYPDVRHVILDATFDDITPLALARMPQSWKSLVALTIKKYMYLNNAEQLVRYPGPILLIRRSKDEMITVRDLVLSTNLGNDLLLKILQHRYPKIVDDSTVPVLKEWLAKDKQRQASVYSEYEVNNELCTSILQSYIEEHSIVFPLQLGNDMPLSTRLQLALFLASKHLEEYDSTHCTPLPASYFKQPWALPDCLADAKL